MGFTGDNIYSFFKNLLPGSANTNKVSSLQEQSDHVNNDNNHHDLNDDNKKFNMNGNKISSAKTIGGNSHMFDYNDNTNFRKIKANDRKFNSKFKYVNNRIKTSKYSLITFLPLNLLEQFQRLANFYFLILLALQLIPIISSLTPITTAIPLIGVLTLTGIKDAYDDIQRHISDAQVNNRKSKSFRNNQIVVEKWSNIQVGDIILVENNKLVPADILLLSTSEPNGLCYIETTELDGESNLKSKQCLPQTAEMGRLNGFFNSFDGEITCEQPNNLLNQFEGILIWNKQQLPLDNENILLRGCVLRNTEWCYGVVIFAGRDTKLMQNSGKTLFKRTNIDRYLNNIIIGIVIFLIIICVMCSIACFIWEVLIGEAFQIYNPRDTTVPTNGVLGAAIIGLLVFFSYAIVMNTVVPISLYVSVEVIRFVQSFFINWDKKMYDAKTKTYAKARTTTLNEDLGQIQFIFTDKTGTLTQNIMTFNKCSINGQNYGEVIESVSDISSIDSLDLSSNPEYESGFKWYDNSLIDAIKAENKDVINFFRLLAVCHTVMPEKINGRLEYKAQSPDEAALVSAARNFGFIFRSRTPESITIEILGKREEYELLNILDFNNVRKRMSVILKKNGRICIYCKGADNVIYDRLKPGNNTLKKLTQDHLNKFAGEGLRTLVLAEKFIDDSIYNAWKKKLNETALSLSSSKTKIIENLYEEIESEMDLVGATAIEDKLQDGVPQTIFKLKNAGIKIWMLTGDKQETAINIGYSCELLSDDLIDVFIIDGNTKTEVENQLKKFKESIRIVNTFKPLKTKSSGECLDECGNHKNKTAKKSPPAVSVVTFTTQYTENNAKNTENHDGFAIVINGISLVHCLTPEFEERFLEITSQCKAVICCRVTPLQKALVVDLIKRTKKAVTLAIGDGANDVSMIKVAHIGVGISGQEGMQAVLASDYSISQFKHLERLLLIHGRWSYYRMCKFLRYFFYKNFAFTLCHFWYAFFCGFSAQTVFDPMYISVYNLFYTSLPVLALGVFEQDVNEHCSTEYPLLYLAGIDNVLFNTREFIQRVLHGVFSSMILFLIPYGAYKDGLSSNGHILNDTMTLGSVIATILILDNTTQIALETSYWTVFNHITIWCSLLTYFIFDYFYNYILGGPYIGSLTHAIMEATFWFTTVLALVILTAPILAIRCYYVDVKPSLAHQIRVNQNKSKRSNSEKLNSACSSNYNPSRKHRQSLRSGYAFAHEEGFGRLITSGKIMRRQPIEYSFQNNHSNVTNNGNIVNGHKNKTNHY
ncbi:probable phospholipid-transporting ATPase IM [Condylostylus longicornis]|uniref:probable phospholipid-transporting ATPase IM n=1 Tax=Condylostylus longicornis TaxID=2530218 RepID=UPI00244E1B38|nr:probable phospholipid-transporting ATPase IM [Condylostylus longicornis]